MSRRFQDWLVAFTRRPSMTEFWIGDLRVIRPPSTE